MKRQRNLPQGAKEKMKRQRLPHKGEMKRQRNLPQVQGENEKDKEENGDHFNKMFRIVKYHRLEQWATSWAMDRTHPAGLQYISGTNGWVMEQPLQLTVRILPATCRHAVTLTLRKGTAGTCGLDARSPPKRNGLC
jgi:hypothetical protein